MRLSVELRWEMMSRYDANSADLYEAWARRARNSTSTAVHVSLKLRNAHIMERLADAKRLGVPFPDYREFRMSLSNPPPHHDLE